MQKNETALLPAWVAHHGSLFGFENLFIFDNGSDDKQTKRALGHAISRGAKVSYQFATRGDFERKGDIISDKIKSLDDGQYDFFFPLDCDEFIGVHRDGETYIDFANIANELEPYRNDPRVLAIGSFLFNDPTSDNRYLLNTEPNKCFFAAGACDYLDIGYHNARSKTTSEKQKTNITYFHYHNRPYISYLYYAQQKMEGRLNDRSPVAMREYIERKGAGGHLLHRLLMSEEEYTSQFRLGSNRPFAVHGIVWYSGLVDRLKALKHPISFSEPTPTKAREIRTRMHTHPAVKRVLSVGAAMKAASRRDGNDVSTKLPALRVSFGSGPVPDGYLNVGSQTLYEDAKGFGWLETGRLLERDRGFAGSVLRRFVLCLGAATFRVNLQPGHYRIVMEFYDPLFEDHVTRVKIGSVSFPEVKLKRHELGRLEAIVEAGDGPVDLMFTSPVNNWIINTLTIEPSTERADPVLQVSPFAPNLWQVPSEGAASPRRLIDRWLQHTKGAIPSQEINSLEKTSYLETIGGIVDHFRQFQTDEGWISDPYERREVQYATPAFAFSSALLVRHADRSDLVRPAAAAMKWSCERLASRSAPAAHEDFFPAFIASALPLLKGDVPDNDVKSWEHLLQGINPLATYRHDIGGSGGPGSNWNCVALVGEYLLHKLGLRGNIDFVRTSLLAQGRLFANEYGLYAEGPMVYDAFPRAWLGLMCSVGYDGPASAELRDALDRGALTSLLIQSPSGELPCGGRSSHHQWADALQCLIFENAATEYLHRDWRIAGAMKRAASRAHDALRKWRRPTGELSVVSNFYSPEDRHGFEVYSAHSQYNLLAAAVLGLAHQNSLPSSCVKETITPAETGGFSLVLPHPFNKVIGNCAGTYVEINLRREPEGVCGLLRVHFSEQRSQCGPSDALIANASHILPTGPRANLAIGASWDHEGKWYTVTDFDQEPAQVDILTQSPNLVSFHVTHRIAHGGGLLQEAYELRSGEMTVRYSFSDARRWSVAWPVLVTDGATETELALAGNRLLARRNRDATEYEVSGCGDIALSDELYPHKRGYMRIARAHVLEGVTPMLTIRDRSGTEG